MAEHLMLADTDPGQDPGFLEQTKKWGGRIVMTAIMGYYLDSSLKHIKHNRLFQRVEEVIHHEHQETPEDDQL